MKLPPSTFFAASLFLTASLACAQTANDLEAGLRLVADPVTPHTYEVSWWGKTGHTYFIGYTDDLLASWSYFPVAEHGQDAVIRYAFTNTAPRVFVRLRYYEETLADPFGLDSDGDGLTNQQEFDLETDPFSADTDGDGMPDGWEGAHGLNPRDPADALADPNGNGVSNLDEYREGTDPNLNFYQGVAPVLKVISGPDQARRSGAFMPLPFRVRVTHSDGTPWPQAPVRFTADADEGLFSLTNDSLNPLVPALTVTADADGYAEVWLKSP